MFRRLCLLFLFAVIGGAVHGQSLTITPDRQLTYRTYENGDRIPDYSFCGYEASEKPLPDVPAKVRVACKDGDATERIQRAIDYVSSLPLGANGFRGAVLLEKGTYRIEGSLLISVSGVVLRGCGYGEDGTVLIGGGTDRSTLIRIAGVNDLIRKDSIPITGQYIPLNATELPLPPNHSLKVGDKIIITRPSTAEWLKSIGADKIGFYVDYQLTHWMPGDFDLRWERTVTAARPTSITIDVPLTNALDAAFGKSYIQRYQW
ncbi:MAG: glycoside hydrolase family 55 protein, partial [Tannerella sp.]|nr:glycoside hydrolase family 55 protein [Tannerella sp.]